MTAVVDASHVEQLRRVAMSTKLLSGPRIEIGKAMFIAGFRQQHSPDEADRAIQRQWRRLWPYLGSLPNQIGTVTYGLQYGETKDHSSDYMCAVEVDGFSGLPPELDRVQLPEQTYAVFAHDGDVTTLPQTRTSVWNDWYPRSGYSAAQTPAFERYGEAFDPASGQGDMEIWFPIKS